MYRNSHSADNWDDGIVCSTLEYMGAGGIIPRLRERAHERAPLTNLPRPYPGDTLESCQQFSSFVHASSTGLKWILGAPDFCDP